MIRGRMNEKEAKKNFRVKNTRAFFCSLRKNFCEIFFKNKYTEVYARKINSMDDIRIRLLKRVYTGNGIKTNPKRENDFKAKNSKGLSDYCCCCIECLQTKFLNKRFYDRETFITYAFYMPHERLFYFWTKKNWIIANRHFISYKLTKLT